MPAWVGALAGSPQFGPTLLKIGNRREPVSLTLICAKT
jgi:hypothetical protein